MSGKKQKVWQQKCAGILKTMFAHKYAWIFKDPVDPVKLNLPDYFNVIKNPMDMGTVKANLDAGMYRHPDDFEREMNLCFNNARTYNPPGSDVHVIAQQMQELFQKKYAEHQHTILQKFDEEAQMATGPVGGGVPLAAGGMGGGASGAVGKVKDKDRSSTKKLLESINFTDSRPMTFEEKRQLTNEMNQLSSKKLGKIVEIIHYKHPRLLKQNEADPDEIEIDIDQIDAVVLRGVQDFVTKALQSSKKKRRAGE